MKKQIHLEVVNRTRKFKVNVCLVKEVLAHIIKKLGIEEQVIIDIAFVSRGEIRRLNKEYRKKDKVTNVLSFTLEHRPKELVVGEIVVSLQKAQEEAKRYGNNFNEYVLFLIIHGFLHVLGLDHEEEEEREKMEKIEEEILQEILKQDRRQVIEICLR
uniref:Endoribonuclease YbeY n=1 Tax=Caldisericum exile TaxID=693075 RepID=A0A7C4YFI2_9BACT